MTSRERTLLVLLTQLNLTLLTDITNSNLEPGNYTIHAVTQGGEDSIGFTYTKPSSQSVYGQQANIRIDFDKGMIPVKYSESTEKWEVVTDGELDSNLDNWFDYDTKKWANAVTVTKDSQNDYYKARAGSNEHYEVNDSDILDYWVYIPRYSYKVMRYSMDDKYASDDVASNNGGFEIVFETSDTSKKTPAACPVSSSSRYYQDCVYVDQAYGTSTGTSCATHPTFT